jgi:predicted hydrocarbon binding protein
MTLRKEILLSILGLLVSCLGAIGTSYQIFGYRFVWIPLIFIGLVIVIFYIWRITDNIRRVVATFGKRWEITKDGQLRIGNTINVALRTKTVQILLNAFEKVLPQRFKEIERQAGLSVGQSFAEDLKRELMMYREEAIFKSGREIQLMREKLLLWAKYDSSTGMGLFTIGDPEYTHMHGLRVELKVTNSFLTCDRRSDTPVCTFLEGYIEGVVSRILDIHVNVMELQCASVTGESYCRFQITGK